jgi:hypothetical protein
LLAAYSILGRMYAARGLNGAVSNVRCTPAAADARRATRL